MLAFRVTYSRYRDLHDDVQQMANGGLLVRVRDLDGLERDAPVSLELVLPDGATVATSGKILQVLAGHGVAVTIGADVVAQLRGRAGKDSGTAAAKHERVEEPAARGAPKPETLSKAEKIQLALHGNRDQRMAILRDHDRSLHAFVLKNPQVNADDALTIAKSATLSGELAKLISERREWFGKPQIALALARNPRTPPDLAVRALDHVPVDALRQMAKGVGALPHVAQAARKKVIK